jgi:hypothetical protein
MQVELFERTPKKTRQNKINIRYKRKISLKFDIIQGLFKDVSLQGPITIQELKERWKSERVFTSGSGGSVPK